MIYISYWIIIISIKILKATSFKGLQDIGHSLVLLNHRILLFKQFFVVVGEVLNCQVIVFPKDILK